MEVIAAYKFSPWLASPAPIPQLTDTFPSLIIDSAASTDWEFIRRTSNYQHTGPIQNINSAAIRCYEHSGRPQAQVANVTAGSKIRFSIYINIIHPESMLVYMAKVSLGQSVADWDSVGNVWFRIPETLLAVSERGLSWPSDGLTEVTTTLPTSLPNNNYLIRVEHIALHSAGGQGGAQFYLTCGQLTVSGEGNGTPGPLVAFPGAYSPTDPGILMNLDWPIPTSYEMPGLLVWQG